MAGDGQARGKEEALHRFFVHAGGRAENSGADVGESGQLEEALDGAIFAERTVQHGEDNIQLQHVVAGEIEEAARSKGTRAPPGIGGTITPSPLAEQQRGRRGMLRIARAQGARVGKIAC